MQFAYPMNILCIFAKKFIHTLNKNKNKSKRLQCKDSKKRNTK